MPWSRSRQRTAAVSAHAPRNQRVSSSRSGIWSASRRRRAEQLPVDVDLLLVPGAVAHPDRPAVPPAAQVGERPLGQVVLAADAEHDLQRLVRPDAARAGGGHEGEEVLGLVRAGRHPERLHGEAGVADPGVAVVPVPFPAHALRQRRRPGGDDRAAGLVGQAVQDPAAEVHEVLPRALVGLVDRRTRTPTPRASGRAARRARPGTRRARRRRRPRVLRCNARCTTSPGREVQPRLRPPVADGHVAGQRQHQPVRAAAGRDPAVHARQQRDDQPVLRPRPVVDRDVDRRRRCRRAGAPARAGRRCRAGARRCPGPVPARR